MPRSTLTPSRKRVSTTSSTRCDVTGLHQFYTSAHIHLPVHGMSEGRSGIYTEIPRLRYIWIRLMDENRPCDSFLPPRASQWDMLPKHYLMSDFVGLPSVTMDAVFITTLLEAMTCSKTFIAGHLPAVTPITRESQDDLLAHLAKSAAWLGRFSVCWVARPSFNH